MARPDRPPGRGRDGGPAAEAGPPPPCRNPAARSDAEVIHRVADGADIEQRRRAAWLRLSDERDLWLRRVLDDWREGYACGRASVLAATQRHTTSGSITGTARPRPPERSSGASSTATRKGWPSGTGCSARSATGTASGTWPGRRRHGERTVPQVRPSDIPRGVHRMHERAGLVHMRPRIRYSWGCVRSERWRAGRPGI